MKYTKIKYEGAVHLAASKKPKGGGAKVYMCLCHLAFTEGLNKVHFSIEPRDITATCPTCLKIAEESKEESEEKWYEWLLPPKEFVAAILVICFFFPPIAYLTVYWCLFLQRFFDPLIEQLQNVYGK